MADISRGPDYFARVLASHYDEEDVEPGEAPVSVLEKVSERFADERAKGMARVTRTKKAVKLEFTLKVTEVISFGSGDAARSDGPAFHIDAKTTKPAPIKGKKVWIDGEGNQVGQEPAQTTIKGIDGGATDIAGKARRKAV